jgi:4'-phosphopantetheinyl transferase
VVAAAAVLQATSAWSDDVLTDDERHRRMSFVHESDRRDFVAGHTLARDIVAATLARDPRLVQIEQTCEFCGRAHGRPSIAGEPALGLSISHASGIVAVATGNGAVGIDVELTTSMPLDEQVVVDVMADAEQRLILRSSDPQLAFLRQWVRKEAVVKAGLATIDSLRLLDLAQLGLPDAPGDGVAMPLGGHLAGHVVVDWEDATLGAIGATVYEGTPATRSIWTGSSR